MIIEKQLSDAHLKSTDINILIVAYKDEGELELYAKKSDSRYKKLITYNVCAKSAALGPKRKQGDAQVPEGFLLVVWNKLSGFFSPRWH